MALLLIGMMGSGKTTLGMGLAEELSLSFTDLDQSIEKEEGLRISQLFSLKGENYFRSLERNHLQQISPEEQGVIATGGGAVLQEDLFDQLKQHHQVVYLKASVRTLQKRIRHQDPTRPLLPQLEQLFQDRKLLYEQAASHILEVDDLSLDECLKALIKIYNS